MSEQNLSDVREEAKQISENNFLSRGNGSPDLGTSLLCSRKSQSRRLEWPHTCEDSYHQKDKRRQVLVRMWGRGNPCGCWWDYELGQALWKIVRQFLKTLKIRIILWSSYPIYLIYLFIYLFIYLLFILFIWVFIQRKSNHCLEKISASCVQYSIFYNSQDMETSWLSIDG